ncbi:MAG: WXG100 family type VII secretion target [Anaerolineae bacterium]
MQIRVHPDALREAAQMFARQSGAMREIEHELQQATARLDTWAWDGHSRARAESLLNRVGPESRHLAERLEELEKKLRHVADEFEETDLRVAQGFTQVQMGRATSPQSHFSYEAAMVSIWGGFALSAGSLIGKGIKAITTAHKVLNAPSISGYTGVSDMALKGIQRAPKHWPFWIGMGGEVLSEIGENWNEFHGDVPRFLVATAVESSLGVGMAMGFAAGGAVLVGAVGGAMLGPPGAIIGSKVGSIIGGWVGSKAAEWLESRPVGGRSVAQLIEEGIVSAPGYVVDQALLPLVNSVAIPVF